MTRVFEIVEFQSSQLQTLIAVERCGSMARAARLLNYAPSTVTLHIQSLERLYGIQLLTRRGRRAELTEGGRLLRDRAEVVLRAAEDLHASIAGLRSGTVGTVTMAAIEPAASRSLSAALASFCAHRPEAEVRIHVGGTTGVSEMVASGKADFGICSAPAAVHRLEFEPLFREPLAALVPDGHPLGRAKRVHPRDLASQRILVTEEGCAYRARVESMLSNAGIQVVGMVEFGSLPGLAAAAQEGVGIAILPAAFAVPAPRGTRLLPLDEANFSITVGVVVPRGGGGRFARPLVQALYQEVRRRLLTSRRSRILN